MSRAEQMREYLRTAGATSPDSAVGSAQIRAALGLDRGQMSSCVGDLKRLGYVACAGKFGAFRYYLTGKVPSVPMTEAESREVERLRQIARRRADGCVSRAEYLAACAAKRAEAASAIAAAKEAKRRARSERKKAAEVVRVKLRVPNKPRVVVGALDKTGPGRTSIAPVKQQIVPAQSVDEWLAQGGKVERLDAFAVSKPFRAIGFNNREAA